jgi:hypothetical protein
LARRRVMGVRDMAKVLGLIVVFMLPVLIIIFALAAAVAIVKGVR